MSEGGSYEGCFAHNARSDSDRIDHSAPGTLILDRVAGRASACHETKGHKITHSLCSGGKTLSSQAGFGECKPSKPNSSLEKNWRVVVWAIVGI